MLRTYILSFAVLTQGVITDLPAEQIEQVTLLAPSLELAKQRILDNLTEEEVPLVQFTDQCREICENDMVITAFEGWPQTVTQ